MRRQGEINEWDKKNEKKECARREIQCERKKKRRNSLYEDTHSYNDMVYVSPFGIQTRASSSNEEYSVFRFSHITRTTCYLRS